MGRKGVQYIQHGAKRQTAPSRVRLLRPHRLDCQAPLSMGFSHEHWNGLPFSSPGHLPDPGIEPRSPTLQAYSLPTELHGKPYTYTRELPIKD